VALGAAAVGVLTDEALPGLLAGIAGLTSGLVGFLPPGRAGPDSPGYPTGRSGADRLLSPADACPAAPARHVAPAAPTGPGVPTPGLPAAVGQAEVADPDEELQGLVDTASGLFTESYLVIALEARIAAARRRLRPVSIVVLDVVESLFDEPVPGDPVVVAASVRATLREADTAGRLANGHYLLVLEDTNETGAVWTVERVRSKLSKDRPGCTMWAGVACYPAHGFTVPEILGGAENALVLARQWRQDRIEVAITE
jgi:GGDEF domain-containing protein